MTLKYEHAELLIWTALYILVVDELVAINQTGNWTTPTLAATVIVVVTVWGLCIRYRPITSLLA